MKREHQLIPDHEERAGIYHCVSRFVLKSYLMNDVEKEYMRMTIRKYEAFCGVRVLTYCLMSNHIHLLVEVPPKQDAELILDATDEEFLNRLRFVYSEDFVMQLSERFEVARSDASEADANGLTSEGGVSAGELSELYIREIKRPFILRMCDLSAFMKSIKQCFSQWYNRENGVKGTLWESRFKSELVQSGYAAQTVAAYIDLNPLRANMVADPKDYRWCGYAEAVAGNKEAQLGLLSVMQGVENVVPNVELLGDLSNSWKGVMGDYRMVLAVDGIAADLDTEPVRGERKSLRYKKRMGFSRAESACILESGGKLSRSELLRCRVRHFSDGVVLGSKEFVNGFFQRLKNSAQDDPNYQGQYEKRRTGARKVNAMSGDPLFSLRDLKKDTLS
ncbi:MAG: putative transposase [Cryomorphaceae bacterium]|jgi:putative transposase